MNALALVLVAAVACQLVVAGPVQAVSAKQVKELNLVFLHGAGGNAGSLQLLKDSVEELLPDYAFNFELANSDTRIVYNSLIRSYPNDVDIASWADNITTSLDKHFKNKKDLILIGHSMGGKTALYSVAHDVNGVADRVAMVVTINSPIKSLDQYSPAGGVSLDDYHRAAFFIGDHGVVDSALHYDSSNDGRLVGLQKHWLAFISAEAAPSSPQFDLGAIDPAPRDMDDHIIPISAQYAYGADVVYYGEQIHGSVSSVETVAGFIADTILRYIFGGDVGFSAFARGGSFEHESNLLPGSDQWVDLVDEISSGSGLLRHANSSFLRWQEWEDVVGTVSPGIRRSSFRTRVTNALRLVGNVFGGIRDVRWFDPDNPADSRLVIRTRAAPRSSVTVAWSVSHINPLPPGVARTHYEVRIVAGTPFTGIARALWLTADPGDTRVQIWSEGDSPFRWFRAEWRVFARDSRSHALIVDITTLPSAAIP